MTKSYHYSIRSTPPAKLSKKQKTQMENKSYLKTTGTASRNLLSTPPVTKQNKIFSATPSKDINIGNVSTPPIKQFPLSRTESKDKLSPMRKSSDDLVSFLLKIK